MTREDRGFDPRYVALIVLLQLVLVVLFVRTFDYRPKSQAMPLLVIPAVFVFLLVELVLHVWGKGAVVDGSRLFDIDRETGLDEPATDDDVRLRRQLQMVGWLFGYVLLIVLAGFIPGSTAFLLAFLLVHGEMERRTAVGTAVVVALFLYVVFVVLLDTPFYGGIFRDSLQEAIVT